MTQLPDTILQRHKQQDETIKLDKEGNWFHGEYPILHERTVQFFHRNIARDPHGRYYLTGEDKPVYFEVEDVPYFIKKIEKTIAGFLIYLTDDSIELLDLKTLSVGSDNALYCLVKGGEFVAKFYRPSYMEMSKFITQEGRDFVIQFGSKKYPIGKGRPEPLVEFEAEKPKKPSKPIRPAARPAAVVVSAAWAPKKPAAAKSAPAKKAPAQKKPSAKKKPAKKPVKKPAKKAAPKKAVKKKAAKKAPASNKKPAGKKAKKAGGKKKR